MEFFLKKGTHTLQFAPPLPDSLVIENNGEIWHDRRLDGKFDKVKVNILFDGMYSSPNNFKIIDSKPLETGGEKIQLYEPERNREKDFIIRFNPELGMHQTPARIFTNSNPAVIEIGQKFYTYPPQTRMFILLHEYGHMFYENEHKTDLFALKMGMLYGLNISQMFGALSNVLHPSKMNDERVMKLFNELKSNGYVN